MGTFKLGFFSPENSTNRYVGICYNKTFASHAQWVWVWDARTRLPGQRTRFRRGDAGGTPQTARPCRVVPRGDSRIGPTQLKSAPTRPKSAPTRPKSGRLGPHRPYRLVSADIGRVRPKFKKKKKVQTHRLTNLKTQKPLRPSHFVQHSQTASLTPSLISLLCVLTVLRPSSLFSVFRALCVSAVCCFSLQVCSLCSFLEFLFFVFYNFSLSNCLEKYL